MSQPCRVASPRHATGKGKICLQTYHIRPPQVCIHQIPIYIYIHLQQDNINPPARILSSWGKHCAKSHACSAPSLEFVEELHSLLQHCYTNIRPRACGSNPNGLVLQVLKDLQQAILHFFCSIFKEEACCFQKGHGFGGSVWPVSTQIPLLDHKGPVSETWSHIQEAYQ